MTSYGTCAPGLAAADLEGFFEGWPVAPSAEKHLRLLESSAHVVLAFDDDGTVVGFVTALSDGVLSAYIPLLEVLPTHRGHGIGSELVRRVLIEIGELYMVDVVCDPDVQPFYARLGFTAYTAGIIRRRSRIDA